MSLGPGPCIPPSFSWHLKPSIAVPRPQVPATCELSGAVREAGGGGDIHWRPVHVVPVCWDVAQSETLPFQHNFENIGDIETHLEPLYWKIQRMNFPNYVWDIKTRIPPYVKNIVKS